MPRLFSNRRFLFLLFVLVPVVPSIIIASLNGRISPVELTIILLGAFAAGLTFILVVRWLKLVIEGLQPERSNRPHVGYPFRRPSRPPK